MLLFNRTCEELTGFPRRRDGRPPDLGLRDRPDERELASTEISVGAHLAPAGASADEAVAAADGRMYAEKRTAPERTAPEPRRVPR